MKQSVVLALLCIAAVFPAAHAQAAPCASVTPIRFEPGAMSAVVQGAVARGELECWSLAAKAGQHARLSVTSREDNAVFQFYQPGWKLVRDQDLLVRGQPYEGAADSDDANTWAGVLAGSGSQLVVVGSTRGGAGYRLTVTIQP